MKLSNFSSSHSGDLPEACCSFQTFASHKRFFSALLAGLIAGVSITTDLIAENMIENGDFQNGVSGFITDYGYSTDLGPEGKYCIVIHGNDVHNAFQTGYDHTHGTTSGRYFCANGASNTSLIVWRSTSPITVSSGDIYRFEAYVRTEVAISGGNAPELKFQIGDGSTWRELGTTTAFPDPSEDFSWKLSYADGKFSNAGTYYVRLVNNQGIAGGNDFGLDDVYFGLRSAAPSTPSNPGETNPETFDTSGMNSRPTASNFTYSPIGNSAKTFDWKSLSSASDADEDPLSAVVSSQGSKGSASVSGNNVTYSPSLGQTGDDTFQLTISDDNAESVTITVTVQGIVPVALPSATTNAASSVASSSATLNGTVNDNNADTTITFQYGTTNEYGTTVTANQSPLAAGSGNTSVNKSISGLTPGTLYHYRVVAQNSVGTRTGSDQTFTTDTVAPSSTANNINFSNTANNTTTINWTRGNGENCVVFIKATDAGTASPVNGATYSASSNYTSGSQIEGWYCIYKGSGTSVNVAGLTAGTNYRVQVFEYNGAGGTEKYLTTTGTVNPANVTTTGPEIDVKGNGNSISDGSNTPAESNHSSFGTANVTSDTVVRTFTIENTGNGELSLSGEPIVSVAGGHAADFSVTTQPSAPTIAASGSLTFEVTFNPSALGTRTAELSIANNDSNENPYNFAISGVGYDAPTATTGTASSISAVGATLNGTVNDNFDDTTVTFEYGPTVSYGSSITADQSLLSAGSGSSSMSKTITGLTQNTTYHYRVRASNSVGTSYGSDQTFTTSVAIPTTQATNTSFTNTSDSGTTINWTRGDGEYCVVFIKQASSGTAEPVDNTTYTANTTFGSGSQIGTSGWYCVYVGTGTSVAVTGLAQDTDYVVQVCEYNGDPGEEIYFNTAGSNNASVTTAGPEINLKGNGIAITDGDNSPASEDHTDFGSTDLTTGTVVRTFSIENTGSTPLNLTGTPIVALSGTHAADFTVTTQPSAATIAANGSLTFEVTFNPSAIGTRTAELSIANSDSDENPYNFAISGVGYDAPTVSTGAASAVSGGGATFNGTVNDNFDDTTVTFEYGTSVSYGSTVNADQSPLAAGSGVSTVNKIASGLNQNTTYHYRVKATNAAGTTYGMDQSFTTDVVVPSSQSTNVNFSGTSNTATTINWTRGDGEYCVVFIKQASSGSAEPVDNTTYTANTTFGSGSQIGTSGWYCVYVGTESSVTIDGLLQETDYMVHVCEYNGDPGEELYFTTTGTNNTILATVGPEINLTGNSRSITDGDTTPTIEDYSDFDSADIAGSSVTRSFTIQNSGQGTLTLSGTPAVAISGTNASDFAVTSQPSSPLAPGTSTSFEVTFRPSAIGSRVAEIFIESNDSDESTFTFSIAGTGFDLPTVSTKAPVSVAANEAMFSGTVNDNHDDTTVIFEYGTSTAYGKRVTADKSPVLAGSGTSEVYGSVSGLAQNTSYHYRIVATNAAGTTYGEDQSVRTKTDTDGDGTADVWDNDSDNDGIPDVEEEALGTDPFNDDTDGDGTPDGQDQFVLDPSEDMDTDAGGLGDNIDPDDDNDGVPDVYDAFPKNPKETTDTDGDGIGDNADPDDDNDGVADVSDEFPKDPDESLDSDDDGIGDNADEDPFTPIDTDNDGIPDGVDSDDDNDGIDDMYDAFPKDASEASDLDFDRIGDNADEDDDADGVPDSEDAFPNDPTEWSDRDGDGVGDNQDTFPDDSNEFTDSDLDGIGDNADQDSDGDGIENPLDAFPNDPSESMDSDGDGIGDNADIWPNDASEAIDTDRDGLGNNADPDDDNDGILDTHDCYPLDPNECLDTDSDGYPDGQDQFPSNPFEHCDNDLDGIGDNYDPDDDNDGIPDELDEHPLSPTQEPLVYIEDYNIWGDTHSFHELELNDSSLLKGDLTIELVNPLPEGLELIDGVVTGVIDVEGYYFFSAILSNGVDSLYLSYVFSILDPIVFPMFTDYSVNGTLEAITVQAAPTTVDFAVTQPVEIVIPVAKKSTIEFYTDYVPAESEFVLLEGNVPTGMKLDPDTGILSGIPEKEEFIDMILYLVNWKGQACQRVQIRVVAEEPL